MVTSHPAGHPLTRGTSIAQLRCQWKEFVRHRRPSRRNGVKIQAPVDHSLRSLPMEAPFPVRFVVRARSIWASSLSGTISIGSGTSTWSLMRAFAQGHTLVCLGDVPDRDQLDDVEFAAIG